MLQAYWSLIGCIASVAKSKLMTMRWFAALVTVFVNTKGSASLGSIWTGGSKIRTSRLAVSPLGSIRGRCLREKPLLFFYVPMRCLRPPFLLGGLAKHLADIGDRLVPSRSKPQETSSFTTWLK